MEARSLRRRQRVLALALTTMLLAGCAATGVRGASFTPTGDPVPLPPAGALVEADSDQFQGMLVGSAGRPVVVNIWASWCPPCRTEAPLLQRAADDYAGRVLFLGVDSRDQMDAGREFLDRYEITYPNLFDDSGGIRRLLGLRGFPTTYIFGADGSLRAEVAGGISEQTLAAHLEDALRG